MPSTIDQGIDAAFDQAEGAAPTVTGVSAYDVQGPTDALLTNGQAALWIAQGDVQPALEVQIVDGDGNPVELAGASVSFRMRTLKLAGSLVNANADVTDAANGHVAYPWIPGDTTLAGDFLGRFHVTFPDDTTLTFPGVGSILIHIVPAYL